MREGRDVSVVVAGGDGERLGATLDALARQRSEGVRVEVIVVRRWPAPLPSGADLAGPLDLRVLEVAAPSDTAAANTGLAAAAGDVVVLVTAGDEPGEEVLALHRDAISAGAAAVVGEVHGASELRDAWVGAWPAGVPAAPVRHVALARGALHAANGLDERLPDLEVAVVDLLARLGEPVVERRDIAVAGAPRTLPEVVEAGRSAHALTILLAERHADVHTLGPRRARVTLRWGEPALRAVAAFPASGAGRAGRLALRAAFARGLVRYRPALEPTARGGLAVTAEARDRPGVSVVVPFAGTGDEAAELLDALEVLRRGPDDQVIVVDNSRSPVVAARPGFDVVRADREWSSYHARNAGLRAASAAWLLFVDSDCRPVPWLIDAYFAEPPGDAAGAVAGGVLSAPARGWAARFSESTEVLSQARSLGREQRPYAVTANLLVRREALEAVGGFAEGVRSGGDADLSWRLLDSGWTIEHRPAAAVHHLHRTTMRGLLRQYRRYGAGAAWLGRRYPGALSDWPSVPRSLLVPPFGDLAAGRFELALVRLTEVATAVAALLGAQGSNRPAVPEAAGLCRTAAFAGTYPDAEAPAAMLDRIASLGLEVAVEARRRPRRFAWPRPAAEVSYAEDDALLDRVSALRWLASRPGGRRAVLAAAFGGRGELRALGAEAAVARRVAARGAMRLEAIDDEPAAALALSRTGDLLGLPATPASSGVGQAT